MLLTLESLRLQLEEQRRMSHLHIEALQNERSLLLQDMDIRYQKYKDTLSSLESFKQSIWQELIKVTNDCTALQHNFFSNQAGMKEENEKLLARCHQLEADLHQCYKVKMVELQRSNQNYKGNRQN